MRQVWKWLLLSVLLGAGMGLLVKTPVKACSCMPPGDPKIELEQATAVFSGRVYSMEASGGALWVHFEVSEVWKGPYQSLITVRTATDSAACGYTFAEGVEYLVYANGDTNDLQVNLCSRTRPRMDAAEDIGILGPGTPVSQMEGSPAKNTFDPNRVLAPVVGILSGAIVVGILLGGLLDFRPVVR